VNTPGGPNTPRRRRAWRRWKTRRRTCSNAGESTSRPHPGTRASADRDPDRDPDRGRDRVEGSCREVDAAGDANREDEDEEDRRDRRARRRRRARRPRPRERDLDRERHRVRERVRDRLSDEEPEPRRCEAPSAPRRVVWERPSEDRPALGASCERLRRPRGDDRLSAGERRRDAPPLRPRFPRKR